MRGTMTLLVAHRHRFALVTLLVTCSVLAVQCDASREASTLRVYGLGELELLKAMPVGAVVPLVGDLESVPDGWTVCNGMPLTRPITVDLVSSMGSLRDLPDYSGMHVMVGSKRTPEGEIPFAVQIPSGMKAPSWEPMHWIIRTR